MYRAGRTAWGLVAVGAATAVGVTTKNPGFIVITFLGTLALPRVLGLIAPTALGQARLRPTWHGVGRRMRRVAAAPTAQPSTPTAQSV